MKKKILAGLLLATLLLVVAVPVLAGYYANLQVVESSGNSYDQVGLNQTLDIDYLADNGYITSTGLDTRVTSGGTAIPHMLAEDKLLFVTDITAYGTANLLFTTGNTALSSFPVITGYGGNVTISDHANLELGNDFGIEFDGWVDTSTDKTYLYNEGNLEDDWVVGYSYNDGSQSKESDHLNLYAYKAWFVAERAYVTDTAVDLTLIDNLWIEWENTGDSSPNNESYFIVSTSKTSSHSTYNASVERTNIFGRTWDILDVSDLSGDYYVRIHARENGVTDTKSEVLVYKVVARRGMPLISKPEAFYLSADGGELEAIIAGDPQRTLTITELDTGEYLVEVWADGTDFGIDIDGVTENSTALSGASVPDNSNDWEISMPYFNCYNHTVGVNHRIRYEPDSIIVGTTLPNEESPGTYDGTITWGANPSGVAVSISGLISDFQPAPAGGTSVLPPSQDVAGPSGQPGWTAGIQLLTTHPLYPLVLSVSDQTNIPVPLVWVLGATLILAMVMVWMIGDRQILHQMLIALAGGGWAAFCYHMGIYPFWVIYIYAVLALAIIVGERSPAVS